MLTLFALLALTGAAVLAADRYGVELLDPADAARTGVDQVTVGAGLFHAGVIGGTALAVGTSEAWAWVCAITLGAVATSLTAWAMWLDARQDVTDAEPENLIEPGGVRAPRV